MLDYAYFHQGELYDCYRKVYTRKELYFFLSYPQKDFLPNIYCNDSDYLQFVSLNSAKEIIGFFNGYINKDYQSLQNLEVINFTGQPNITFQKMLKIISMKFSYVKIYERLNLHVLKKIQH